MGIYSVGIKFAGVFEGAMVGAIIFPCVATPLIEGIDATYLASDKKGVEKKNPSFSKEDAKKVSSGRNRKIYHVN